jgi:fumarate reductase flavoprotein subunit
MRLHAHGPGGYNVALAAGDSIERHFMDTIEGGKWLPDQDLAWTLVTKAVERVHELENELGCFFDRNPDGTLHRRPSPDRRSTAPSTRATSPASRSSTRLAEQVWSCGVERLEEHRAVELVKSADGQSIAGVLLIDMREGGFVFVQARAVLLATGGGPTMYKFHTPSGDKSCDGLAMALRAGLTLRDMEMVQFHPTGLLAGVGTRLTGTIIEEGLRGAGGYLLDGSRQRFMHKHDTRGERATRDIGRAGCLPRCARATRRRAAASTSRWGTSGPKTCASSSRGWSSVARTADSTSPAAWSRSFRRRIT